MARSRFLAAILIAVLLTSLPALPAVGQPASGAEILWDTWGVPHVFAVDVDSAFRAFGWAQMHSHGNLLLRLYAQARGRSAEYFGDDGTRLAGDRGVRTLGLYEHARRQYAAQSPDWQRRLDAFATGINAYAEANPAGLDERGRAVLPVDGVDIAAHVERIMFEFVGGVGGCLGYSPIGSILGSNGWAIGPSHSESGNAMLLANPHLIWAEEHTFFEAHIVAPGYDVYGVTLVGFPVLAIAFNEDLGWTHTVNTLDGCDVYELKTAASPAGDGYVLDGQVRPFEVHTDTLKIRGADGALTEEPLVIRRSVHGPVFERDGGLFAVRAAPLQVSTVGTSEGWWEMGAARSLEQFRTALEKLRSPFFNVIYADRDGHIMLVFNGHLPVRSTGDFGFWQATVPGDRSDLIWTRTHAFDELPQVVDPAAGWVQNSNSAPWFMTRPVLDPAQYPPYTAFNWKNDPAGGAFTLGLREERAIRMLTEQPKLSYDKMIEDKFSTRSELADRVLDDLVAAARERGTLLAKQAAEVLAAWDRLAEPDSTGAALFLAWDTMMNESGPGQIFAVPLDPNDVLRTPRGLKDPDAAVATLDRAAQMLQAAAGRLDIPYGEAVRMRRGEVDLPARGGTDSMGVFRVLHGRPGADGRYEVFHGDTFIAALEFATPLKAKVLLTYGNTTDAASPHYGDQLALYARNELRDAWRTRAEVEAHLESRTVIEP